MRTRKEFINFYNNEIIPYISELEEERKKPPTLGHIGKNNRDTFLKSGTIIS